MNTVVDQYRQIQPLMRCLPCTGAARGGNLPLVLLHGWGHTSACWDRLLPHLRCDRDIYLLDLPGFGANADWQEPDLDAVLASVEQLLPGRCFLMGWSLGGTIAAQLSERCAPKIAGVVTLASNRCFVAKDAWPHAMPLPTFADFTEDFARNPAACFRRFCGLQVQGDKNARELLRVLRKEAAAPQPDQYVQWQAGLKWLGQVDIQGALERLQVPLLQLFGEKDALVPVAAAQALKSDAGQVEILAGAGHALPLGHAGEVARHVLGWLARNERASEGKKQIDKRRMAQSFSRAAATYDDAAHLQRQVATRLLQFCPAMQQKQQQQPVLDLGCGTGLCTEQLLRQQARVTALDIAPGMLDQARRKLPQGVQWVCGDAEKLPFGSALFSGVVSSLTVQWSEALDELLAEVQRVLRPGGWCLFSTLGPETLHELRAAWRQVDHHRHVNDFAAAPALRSSLSAAGLQLEVFHEERLVPTYDRLTQLMHELKALGAHNVNTSRKSGLTSPHGLQQLTRAYDTWRDQQGKLPATYQVFHVLARKPR